MDKDTLKQLVTDLLGGREMNDVLFLQLANIEKDKVEQLRPWSVLRTEDSSITVSASRVFTDTQALPTRFYETYGNIPVILSSGDDTIEMQPIGLSKRYQKQLQFGFYYIDHKNKTIGFTGPFDKNYTLILNAIIGSPEITDAVQWEFPARFHPYLAFKIVMTQKGSIDYDEINARMVQFHGIDSAEMWNIMIQWDARLQVQDNQV